LNIVVNGGLGNQLFQYAYGHFNHAKISEFGIYRDANPRSDRPFELDALLINCEHARILGNSRDKFLRYRFGFVKIIEFSAFGRLRKFAEKIVRVNLESLPFTYVEELSHLSKSAVSAGYFQHWKYIEDVWSQISNEISATLLKATLPDDLKNLVQNSIVVHVRQGDLRNVRDTMGILSKEYYEEILDQIKVVEPNKQIIVVTDDLEGATETMAGIAVRQFFGPSDLDSWATLRLMSLANTLITANSTLSWWGAFLAHKNGARVYLPDPWFKNWSESVGNAFYFNEATLHSSKFT
jgi:hypothetical protein